MRLVRYFGAALPRRRVDSSSSEAMLEFLLLSVPATMRLKLSASQLCPLLAAAVGRGPRVSLLPRRAAFLSSRRRRGDKRSRPHVSLRSSGAAAAKRNHWKAVNGVGIEASRARLEQPTRRRIDTNKRALSGELLTPRRTRVLRLNTSAIFGWLGLGLSPEHRRGRREQTGQRAPGSPPVRLRRRPAPGCELG